METKDLLFQAIVNDRVAHAYLLEGLSDTAKGTVAKAFSKALLCESPTPTGACGTCPSCLMFDKASHPNFHFLQTEEDTIKIREHVIPFFQDIRLSSPYSKRKVYVIAQAEKMNTASQNCILKTLEEPVEGVVILLLTENSNALLSTILSRVIRYVVTDPPASFQLLDSQTQEKFLQIIQRLESPRSSVRIALANELAGTKEDLPALLDILQQYYRNSLVEKYTADPRLRNTPKTDKISASGAMTAIRCIEEFRFALKSNANLQLAIDVLITKLADAYTQA